MIELKHITLNQYLEAEEKSEYDFVMKYSIYFSESHNKFNLPEWHEWSFGFINDYSFMLYNGMNLLEQINYIIKLFKEFNIEIEIGKLKLDTFCHLRNFINDCVIEATRIENEMLSSSLTSDEIKAGANEKFKGLENHIKLSYLCGGDLTKLKEIEKLSWSLCFNELLYRHRTKEYNQILNKK